MIAPPFTIADVEMMIDFGILPDDHSFELWDGEIVAKDMPKNDPHETWKRRLDRWLQRALPDGIDVGVEPTLRLGLGSYVEPDILIHPSSIAPSQVLGWNVLLAIEVADTSLQRDLRGKAQLYARHGVPHYWMLDVERRQLHMHSDPQAAGFSTLVVISVDDLVTLPFEPALSLRLSDVL